MQVVITTEMKMAFCERTRRSAEALIARAEAAGDREARRRGLEALAWADRAEARWCAEAGRSGERAVAHG